MAPAATTTLCPRSYRRWVPTHPSSQRIPSREWGWSPSRDRSASAAAALQRRAQVLASVLAWIPTMVAGLDRDNCVAPRVLPVRMPVRRWRRRWSLHRANDAPLGVASGPRQGPESWSRQFGPFFAFFYEMTPVLHFLLPLSRRFFSVVDFSVFAYPAVCVVRRDLSLAIVRTLDFYVLSRVSVLFSLPVRIEVYKECLHYSCAHDYPSNCKP